MLFFNSRRYAEETEKKRSKKQDPQEHSLPFMTFLAILATFPPLRVFLKLCKRRVVDQATVEPAPADQEQIPIIYIHGFRGGDYTTRVMVEEAGKSKGDPRFLKVEADLTGHIKLTGTYTGDSQPIIQLALKDRIAGYQAINYYLSFLLPFLSQKYGFTRYSAVAHSLGSPCVVATEMRYAKKKKFPHLVKCALIAGPFNGVMYLGDIPNLNHLTRSGRPSLMTPHYSYMLRHRGDFNPAIQVLNIYGNVLDTTNSDRFISVISAKSIRYVLAPHARFYQEVEVRGENAEHSQMHDEPFVINILDHFLELKKQKEGKS